MSGLENIIARITGDSAAECEKIISDGAAKADEYKALMQKRIADECEKLLDDAKTRLAASERMADSGADLKYRQSVLSAKNDIITDALSKALTYLNSMPEKEYFAALASLCAANAEDGKNGEIRFNSADLKRLPASFEAQLNDALKAKKASVTVSKTPADISGGFVLVYGDIEENCCFEAILGASSDMLRDIVNEKLFA